MLNLGKAFINIVWITIGGLLVLTVLRMALKKWRESYFPKPDGSNMTIFGIPIPGWDMMKSMVVGIRNFLLVGLPNLWTKVSFWAKRIWGYLFGRNGIFKTWAHTKGVIMRIVGAWIMGHISKKGARTVFKWLGNLLAPVLNAVLPGAGTALKVICIILPELIIYITNQILSFVAKRKVNAETEYRQAVFSQRLTGKKGIAEFKKKLLGFAKSVKPFKF